MYSTPYEKKTIKGKIIFSKQLTNEQIKDIINLLSNLSTRKNDDFLEIHHTDSHVVVSFSLDEKSSSEKHVERYIPMLISTYREDIQDIEIIAMKNSNKHMRKMIYTYQQGDSDLQYSLEEKTRGLVSEIDQIF